MSKCWLFPQNKHTIQLRQCISAFMSSGAGKLNIYGTHKCLQEGDKTLHTLHLIYSGLYCNIY